MVSKEGNKYLITKESGMGRILVVLFCLVVIVSLTACDSGENLRRQDVNTYQNEIANNAIWLSNTHDKFFETLQTHKLSSIGAVSLTAPNARDGYDRILSDEEYMLQLTTDAQTYAEEYEQYSIVVDEYYAYLSANEKELRKDGVNVVEEKLKIQQSKARHRANGEAIATALTDLVEEQEAIGKARQELTKQVISLLLAVI